MELQFYKREINESGVKYDEVKFRLDKRWTRFQPSNKKIGKVPIYKDASNVVEKLFEEEERITELIKKYDAEIILACSMGFLEKIVKNTQSNQVDVIFETTLDRNMLYYIQIGCSPSILIITLK